MWLNYIDQDWYKEDISIYDDELLDIAKNLKCEKEDVFIVNMDDEYDFCSKLLDIMENYGNKLFIYKGCEILFIYYEGGGVSFFTKSVNINELNNI